MDNFKRYTAIFIIFCFSFNTGVLFAPELVVAQSTNSQNSKAKTTSKATGKKSSSTKKTSKKTSSKKSASAKKASAAKKTSSKTTSSKKTSSKKDSTASKKSTSSKKTSASKTKNKKDSKKTRTARSNAARANFADSESNSELAASAAPKWVLPELSEVALKTPIIASPELFATPVQAMLYTVGQNNADWLLPHEKIETVASEIAALKPSLVSNFVLFNAGALPKQKELKDLQFVRNKVLYNNSKACFELVLDARNYKTPEEIVLHMRKLAQSFDFELFFIRGLEAVNAQNPSLVSAATSEAKAQKRLVGAAFDSKIVAGLDYVAIYAGDAQLEKRLALLKARIPVLATMDNDSKSASVVKNYAGGRDFVKKNTPAERRKLLLALSKQQATLNFSLAYPLFFPLYTSSQSYDALRDEFMKDTLHRIAKSTTPKNIFAKAVLD